MTQLEEVELFGYFSRRSERERELTNKYIDDKIKSAMCETNAQPPLCDVALTNDDKDLFTEIMGEMLDIKGKPGTLCFCMEEILKHFDVKRKRDFA